MSAAAPTELTLTRLADQVDHLEQRMAALAEMCLASRQLVTAESRQQYRPRFQPGNQQRRSPRAQSRTNRVCLWCDRKGHLEEDCFAKQRYLSRAGGSPLPPTNSSSSRTHRPHLAENRPEYFCTAPLGDLEQRCAAQLAQFNVDIQYRPDRINLADAPSRIPGEVLQTDTAVPVEIAREHDVCWQRVEPLPPTENLQSCGIGSDRPFRFDSQSDTTTETETWLPKLPRKHIMKLQHQDPDIGQFV